MQRIQQQIVWFLFLGILVSGCAAPPTKVSPQDTILQDLCRSHNIDWDWDSVSQIVTLSRGALRARAMVGSDMVALGKEKITLSAPLKRQKNVVIVPADFKRKVIDWLSEAADRSVRKFRTIMIDAGHGGKDPGAIGNSGIKEKTVVLEIAKHLRQDLEGKGFKVVMTRDSDEFISLPDRARMANSSKADLFVSIHANSSRTKSVDGMEIYFLKNLDHAALKDVQKETNYQDVLERFSMDRIPELNQVVIDMLYVHKQDESRKLAGYLSKNATGIIDSADRGIKAAGFYVLKNTLIPAILIEVGFLSNHAEEDMLATSAYRQKIADGLAQYIANYATRN